MCCNTGARDEEQERAILAVLLEGCAGKTAATRGALITGGKRLRSLGNVRIAFQCLNCWQQLSSSREGE